MNKETRDWSKDVVSFWDIEIHRDELVHEIDTTIRPNKKHKWTDIYNNEDEIIEDLKHVEAKAFMTILNPFAPWYRGYEFIHSFAKQVKEGKTLSPKQITQCKRLASEIKKARIFGDHVRKYNK